MSDLASLLIELVVGCGPFVGYYLMLRRRDRTRAHLIMAAMLGAAGPAILFCTVMSLTQGMSPMQLLPWVWVAATYGAVVGILGVLARILGAWLSGRQD